MKDILTGDDEADTILHCQAEGCPTVENIQQLAN